MSSADNLCKHWTKIRPDKVDLDQNCLTLSSGTPEGISFKKFIFKKSSRQQKKKHAKNYPACKELNRYSDGIIRISHINMVTL